MLTRQFTDQMDRKVSLEKIPTRIVSIVPSQTELLFDLGLDEEIIGITRFCIRPKPKVDSKQKVGGTKKLKIEKIHGLKPDLIIGNKEENNKEQLEELMKHHPVWMSNVKTLDDALEMIEKVGEIVDRQEAGRKLQNSILENFSSVTPHSSLATRQSVAYLIWRRPYMTVSKDTFIHHMLRFCGFENVFASSKKRYPEITAESLQEKNPDLIFLSSEPYPFREKHLEELRTICPSAKVLLVDGEMFSWYGSRLLHAPEYFSNLIKLLA